MNFIQKIPIIFALAPDDKGLYIFFFQLPHVEKKIEKKYSNVLFIALRVP